MAAEPSKMFAHERTAGKEEWLTPRHVIEALAPFDLDPCASIVRPWPTAAMHYTIEDNGLAKPWAGRVWCNPPYGSQTGRWLARLRDHGDGIALVFARTETRSFFDAVWGGGGRHAVPRRPAGVLQHARRAGGGRRCTQRPDRLRRAECHRAARLRPARRADRAG